jgi:hypothetical protein
MLLVRADNWEISCEDFKHLTTMFGTFTFDLFAVRDNAKCIRFYSKTWEEGSCGVDAFAQNWAGECVYAAPPVSLVMRTIRKAAVSAGMKGILVIPLWKNAKFWTFAFRDGTHLNAMFNGVQIVGMHTLAWESAKKDVLGGKEMQFLVITIGTVQGNQALESLPVKGSCFKRLFGRVCKVCASV